MGSWRKLASLSWADRRLLARAAAMLAHARLALPSTAFRAGRAERSPLPDPATAATDLARAKAIARVVDIAASRLPFRVSCLHRAIVLWRLLSAERIACDLELGARAGTGPFEAHAWVDCQGIALGENPDRLARYRRFARPVVPSRRRGGSSPAEARRPT